MPEVKKKKPVSKCICKDVINHGFSSSSVSIEAIAKCFPKCLPFSFQFIPLWHLGWASSSSLTGSCLCPSHLPAFPPHLSHSPLLPFPMTLNPPAETTQKAQAPEFAPCLLGLFWNVYPGKIKRTALEMIEPCGGYWWRPSLSFVVLANPRGLHRCTFSVESTKFPTCTH